MIVNVKLGKNAEVEVNQSKVSLTWINPETKNKEHVLKNLDDQETRCALLANLMVSAGITGKVISISSSL